MLTVSGWHWPAKEEHPLEQATGPHRPDRHAPPTQWPQLLQGIGEDRSALGIIIMTARLSDSVTHFDTRLSLLRLWHLNGP